MGEVPSTAPDVAAGLKWACDDWELRSQEDKSFRAVINISWITKDHPDIVHSLKRVRAVEYELHRRI